MNLRSLAIGLSALAFAGAVSAQTYTPNAKDWLTIQDHAFGNHRVVAKDYIATQTGGAAALAANNTWTGTNTFSNSFTVTPASHNVTISPTGTGTVTIDPAGALTINPTTASALDNTVIGGSTPLAGTFTTFSATTLERGGNLICSTTAPTIANGGGLGTVGTIVGDACAFDVTAGTGAGSVFVITLPTAAHGWVCNGADVTTNSTTVFVVKQVAIGGTTDTTHATMGNYNDTGALAAVGTGDHLRISCMAY